MKPTRFVIDIRVIATAGKVQLVHLDRQLSFTDLVYDHEPRPCIVTAPYFCKVVRWTLRSTSSDILVVGVNHIGCNQQPVQVIMPSTKDSGASRGIGCVLHEGESLRFWVKCFVSPIVYEARAFTMEELDDLAKACSYAAASGLIGHRPMIDWDALAKKCDRSRWAAMPKKGSV
jgi:hypothetical protein